MIAPFALVFALAIANPTPAAAPSGAAVAQDGHARRGAVLARTDGAPALSSPACASACALTSGCQAWTWRTGLADRPARCELHAWAAEPVAEPGAVTGLAPALADRIEAASDRPPSALERAALRAADGVSAPAPAPQGAETGASTGSGGLLGG